ncbi:diguanylate cyclase/phosphodiesterase with PAS/PAC sensor(s) [Geobacter metallireducens RCH3]|uniref:Sensor diguanylate cyclase/phosphodiesterase, PAS, PAS and PAS domain-containing n=1 Tax=Geobacter metallireducens (strain ATCC 53774 / DSM 7210 / GS-15) TaxID=269799 RepID=Q39R25_GEOMG|nr:EAL domain-containing protein [Geobacter metallireducens]ABB33299.1 sensor diguanylate cyclase/phosphodiesterase, PAS, PAS and PAS domain-containing [Geobacter metallireducens GS-15]EHP84266.1 diguanylate cyclase/phosphodiesterase with PAS/PAC sensor(s) [Geobacter metallireducens RCH3]
MGLAEKSDKILRYLPSPKKQLLALLLIVFVIELFLMVLLPRTADGGTPLAISLLDALLLVILSAPIIWLSIVRPLRSVAFTASLHTDLLLDHIADGIISFDGAGRLLSLNPAAEQLFGYQSAEATGRSLGDILAIRSTGKDNPLLTPLVCCGEEHSRLTCEAEGIRSDGSRFPAALSLSRVQMKGVWHFLGIVRDVTESRETGERLRETNEKLDTLIQASPQGIVAVDCGGKVTLWNRAAVEIFGWSAEEVLGKPYPVAPAERAAEHRKLRELVLQGKRITDVELRRRRKDGSPIDVSLSAAPICDGSGTPLGVITIISDISARKRNEQELVLLKRAMESSINGITITDATHPDNPIIYVNPAFERITGYGVDEVIDKNPRFLRGDDRDQAELKKLVQAFKEEREGCFVLRNYRKDGSPFWNELFIAPVRDRDGVVTNYIGVMNDITEHRRYEEQLVYQATHDPLTGLPNRNLLQDRLGQALALEAFRRRNPICVMFLDLDNFKKVNDTLGHTVGDMLLKAVANRLKNCLRGGDTVARLGGDEYIIVLPNVREVPDVITVAKKMINVFAAPLLLMGNEIYVTASIGIALFPTDGETVDALLKNADAAMYHAKEQGKNNYQFYSAEMNIRVFERLSLETSLHRAVKNQEFLLHYQPRVDLRNGRICGVEALVRWNHPEMGLVSPAKFIPLAEETGLIVPMGEWVLRTACAQNKAWQDAGLPPLRMAVNLSARQFRQENLIAMVEEILMETGLAPQWLELELTESLVMQEAEKSAAILRELTDRGIEVAIDDFGTGYSSLSYLKRFPIANLKIDQAFIRDMTRDPDDATLVKTIITMAHGLGMKTIAEGVELAEQIDFLCRHQCEEMQGYYFSRPITAEELGRLLADGKTLDLSPVNVDPRDRIRAV